MHPTLGGGYQRPLRLIREDSEQKSVDVDLQPGKNKKIDAALLGKIVLARFLEKPLRGFDHFVARVESSAGFSTLAPWVTVARLGGAQVMEGPGDLPSHAIPSLLGEVREMDGRLRLVYRRESFAREYRFDEAGLRHLRSREDSSEELAGTLHRLRLIDSRNRLTYALLQAVLESQAAYLLSGEPSVLVPLTQAQMSGRLRVEAELPFVADAGRISRLVRVLSITLPNRRTVALAELFPRPRKIHCHHVYTVIEREKAWIAGGTLKGPLSDEAIAKIIERENGMRLLRRTVANIRHALAIPDCRGRSGRMNYLASTEGFSALIPLTPEALRKVVPAHSGVYEIRAASASDPGGGEHALPAEILPPKPHGVVYIGSAADLRKRLGDHLRGSSDNALLYRHIAEGTARVRYRLVSKGWRWVERELYRGFRETFGVPPLCNRMSP